MALSPLSETYTGNLLGKFRNTETRVWFEYSTSALADRPFGPEFGCKVWLHDGSFRWAKVLRTVAYVVTDEAADGSPITERWEISAHKEYDA